MPVDSRLKTAVMKLAESFSILLLELFNLHFLSVMLESDAEDLDAVLLEQLSDVWLAKSARVVADVDLVSRPTLKLSKKVKVCHQMFYILIITNC
jgi:hypothetical protein